MDCCAPSKTVEAAKTNCPSCGEKGKNVPIITLKSLLKASSLETIDPNISYYFCSNSFCNTVYFNNTQTFKEETLKVPVFQKNPSMSVPVCYCFDWTRERIVQTVNDNLHPVDQIKGHVQSKRCGCEVNNPQGACCLGNVTAFIGSIEKG